MLKDDVIEDRVEKLEVEVLNKSEEYCLAKEKSNLLFHQIKDLLPEEQQGLLFELESEMNSKQYISEYILYKQGLRDGFKIKE